MAHVGFSALNAYGPDGGVFNAGGCRGRRRLGRSAAADALPVVKTAASFQESPGKATIIPSPSTGGNMLGSRPTTATRTARRAAALMFVLAASVQIGRESCWERVGQDV